MELDPCALGLATSHGHREVSRSSVLHGQLQVVFCRGLETSGIQSHVQLWRNYLDERLDPVGCVPIDVCQYVCSACRLTALSLEAGLGQVDKA